jgi:hypothetical protein
MKRANFVRMPISIARANRVFPGKHNGLIVDHANVFASLERALAPQAFAVVQKIPFATQRDGQ